MVNRSNSSKFPPSRDEIFYFDELNNKFKPLADSDGAVAVRNDLLKIRDGFEFIDNSLWEVITGNGDIIETGGNTQGSGYVKISKSLDNEDTDTVFLSKFVVDAPFRIGFGMSLSQRIAHQRFSIGFVGVDEYGNVINEIPLAESIAITTLSQTTTTLTVTTSVPHGYVPADRVIVYGVSDSRFNYGELMVANVINPTQFTVTATSFATIPSLTASVNNSGFVQKVDPFMGANDALGVFWEGTSASNAKLISRSKKSTILQSSDTSLGSNHTNATQASTGSFSDAFNPAYIYDIRYKTEGVVVRTFPTDSTGAQGGIMKRTQVVPDIAKGYKIRIRARNDKSMTKPVAKISNASKTASTTATITTVNPHGLTTGDQIMIYGIRDQTNFANLTTATTVASVVNATTFTIAFGASATATSKGGVVIKVNGTYGIAPISQSIQSMSASGGVLNVIGSANWSGLLYGETVELRGLVDSSNGTNYVQYEGVYKVANISTTTLQLIAPNVLDFASINMGGAIIKRTDMRLHLFRAIDYSRHTVEIDGAIGNHSDYQEALPVNAINFTSAITSGQSGHDSAISGNPFRIAGRALTANYTTVATGDTADLVTTLVGALIVKPYSIPELDWSYAPASAITNTTDVALKGATASIKNYLTCIQMINTSATATEVVIKDGTTVIWRGYLGANMTSMIDIQFPTPLKTTANTALNFACITTGANVYVNAQGYQAP